jgi:hypothetical protein
VEAEDIFNSLAADGTVQIPLQELFWSARCRAGRAIRHSVEDQLWEALAQFLISTQEALEG